MSRKQESPGFFFVDCTSIHCDRSQQDDLEAASEISDWTESLQTATHSQTQEASPICRALTPVYRVQEKLSPLNSPFSPNASASTQLASFSEVQVPKTPTSALSLSLSETIFDQVPEKSARGALDSATLQKIGLSASLKLQAQCTFVGSEQ